jgi:hypothetical protein
MYLRLTTTNWDMSEFVISDKQKDYDYVEKDNLNIFIYGYPFDSSTNSWTSSNDVYQMYLRDGLDFVEDIEGIYTILIFDKIKRSCSLITDRYGIYTLFYLKNDKHIIISDTIGEIIDHMQYIKLNRASIIEYLNFGFKLGNKTHIEDIYEFKSATIYQISKELEITEECYWNLLDKTEKEKMTEEEFRKIFNEHILTAMSLSEKVSLPLTGGLDTRTILSSCIRKKERLHCYTHGPENHGDIKLAQKICRHFGIGHDSYTWDEHWIKNLPSNLESNALMFNGLISLTYLHVIESLKKESRSQELFITGALGNQLYRHHPFGNKVADSTDLDDASLFIIKNLPSVFYFKTDLTYYYNNLFNNYNSKEMIDLMKESIKTELMKAKNVKNANDLSDFFLFSTYCSNTVSNSLKLTGKYFKVFNPFFHKNLLQQIRFISLKEKTNGHIQKYIIEKNNSYLANLPYASSNRILKYMKLSMNMVSRRVIKRGIFSSPNIVDYADWMRNHHKEFIRDVLNHEKMVTKGLFRKQELEKIVELFLNDNHSLSGKKKILLSFSIERFIFNIISLEIWLKGIQAQSDFSIME